MNEKDILAIEKIIKETKALFLNKYKDYGLSWVALRQKSLTDQIFIKSKRIRNIEELEGKNKIDEDERIEYIGIINYCIMALLKIWHKDKMPNLEEVIKRNYNKVSVEELSTIYDNVVKETLELLKNKNHDYSDAWKDMRRSSITDLIIVKLIRVKTLEDNTFSPIVSEDIDAQFCDILNYSIFAVLKIDYEEYR